MSSARQFLCCSILRVMMTWWSQVKAGWWHSVCGCLHVDHSLIVMCLHLALTCVFPYLDKHTPHTHTHTHTQKHTHMLTLSFLCLSVMSECGQCLLWPVHCWAAVWLRQWEKAANDEKEMSHWMHHLLIYGVTAIRKCWSSCHVMGDKQWGCCELADDYQLKVTAALMPVPH